MYVESGTTESQAQGNPTKSEVKRKTSSISHKTNGGMATKDRKLCFLTILITTVLVTSSKDGQTDTRELSVEKSKAELSISLSRDFMSPQTIIQMNYGRMIK